MKKILQVLLLLIPALSFAHGGRTNKDGCHTNKKTGDYHCHNSGTKTSDSTSSYKKYKQAIKQNTPNEKIIKKRKHTQTHPKKTTKVTCNIKKSMSDDDMKKCGITIKNNSEESSKNNKEISEIVLKVQESLKQKEYYSGTVNGILGAKTIRSILVYKEVNNLSNTKTIDDEFLSSLGIKLKFP